jgi:hypothetical protein
VSLHAAVREGEIPEFTAYREVTDIKKIEWAKRREVMRS